ncbi:hypothetical protein KFL_000710100 [Klebsormidium nitens]|uniref:Uncharacterized protein n=1 Tax=Klebsormidium nitens TaxID=105231 RepID=A0A1Y1HR41_KLENI|nr:hypothetical protein KFL_000710100 [Klebsormidium nitens]|eukprot:GAQ81105.1 hypothetical protein KFL_000710100 [Klebsormidium nitens]
MERFLIKKMLPLQPVGQGMSPSTEPPKLGWHEKRAITGQGGPQQAWVRMLQLYAQLGSFPQSELSTSFPPPPNAPGWFNRNQNGAQLSTWGETWDSVEEGTHVVAQRPYVSSLEFDSRGELLASTSSVGCITVHEYDQARTALQNGGTPTPLVSLSTRLRLEKISWNPADENQVAVCASGTANLFIFDLSVVSNEPKELLTAKPPSNVGFTSFNRLGLCDLAFSRGQKYRIAAAGQDGRMYLWDSRSGRKPTTSIGVPGLQGALTSLQFSQDEQVLYAGSEGGCIHGWDLRGGTQGAFMRASEDYHRPICRLVLADLLQSLASLSSQTDVETSAIHALAFNPSNPRQLAFHLNNGWSGAVDTLSQKITHAYCPPPPWQDGLQTGLAWTLGRRRRPVWLPTGSVFCVPASNEPLLTFLDFTAHPRSRCWVGEDEPTPSGEAGHDRQKEPGATAPAEASRAAAQQSRAAAEKRQRHSRSVEPPRVLIDDPPASVAVHPLSDELAAGTQAGTLVFVGTRGRPVEKDVEPLDRRRETNAGEISQDDPVQVPNAVSVSEGRIVFQYAAREVPD